MYLYIYCPNRSKTILPNLDVFGIRLQGDHRKMFMVRNPQILLYSRKLQTPTCLIRVESVKTKTRGNLVGFTDGVDFYKRAKIFFGYATP